MRRLRHDPIWQDNIKTYFKEGVPECTLVDTVINLRFPQEVGEFLTCVSISFSKAVLHGFNVLFLYYITNSYFPQLMLAVH
jgi:hypothetical protein